MSISTWLNTLKLLITLLLLVGVNSNCYASDDKTNDFEDSESPEARSRENNDEGEAALKESDQGVDEDGEKVSKMEALEYYDLEKHPENRTFEMPRGWAVDFTKRMYAAGAEKVWVTRISEEEWDGKKFKLSDDLLIVLPVDPVKRKSIFELWNAEMEDDERKFVDVGQKFLFFVAD